MKLALSIFFRRTAQTACLSFIFAAGAHPPRSHFDAYELAQSAAPDLAVARYRVELADGDRATAFERILPRLPFWAVLG